MITNLIYYICCHPINNSDKLILKTCFGIFSVGIKKLGLLLATGKLGTKLENCACRGKESYFKL